MYLSAAVICTLLALLCTCSGSDVVVNSNFGQIRGHSVDGVNAFLGVPYAQPPVGNLRYFS